MRIFRICPGFLIPSVCLNFIYQTRIRLVSACEDVTLFTARRPRLVARQTGKEHNMKDIKWTIQYDRPPAPLRHCKKCNIRQEFVSSGQFRVNAQGKYLDIWLIYKCSCCSSTWNAAIYSRVNPGNLPPGMLSRFHSNDPSLAMQYAMDTGFLRLNGAQVQLPSYHVEGQVFRLADSPASTGPDSSMVLRIDNPYPLPLRVHAVLKSKLQLSQKRLDQLTQSGRIQCEDGRELKKSRTGNHIRLYITGVLIP